ncbi:MAG: methyl-accepting chemotaxis protein [Deltaproteobacteria bacterium]|nr:methyl-accepting chemotaxis protein [Deltaproteobacteria bacterium]
MSETGEKVATGARARGRKNAGVPAAGRGPDLELEVKRLRVYAENVDKQVMLLGNELAFANCVKYGLVEPFFTTDAAFNVTYINGNMLALCGRKRDASKLTLDDVLRVDEEDVVAVVQGCAKTGKPAMGIKATLHDAEAVRRRFLINAGPLKKSTGEIVGIYCILQDITDLEGLEERNRLFDLVREATVTLRTAVSQILSTIAEQNASLSEQSAAVAQTTATIKETSQAAQQTAEHAQSVIEFADRAEEVSGEGQHSVERAVAATKEAHDRVVGIADSVVELSEQASQIGEIVTTVSELADQTNMLALNASIEAAKAGEYGKGFAVVAVEMRKLAEQSQRSTHEIRGILGEVQKVVRQVVKATEDGSAKVDEGVKLSGVAGENIDKLAHTMVESSQAAKQIAMSARQQSVGFDQVSKAMGNIAQATTESVAAVRQLESAARDLRGLAERLTELVQG